MTAAVFALLAAAGAQPAAACVNSAFAPLPLSSFEGADGDQCDSDGVGSLRDWENVANDPALSSAIDAPSDNDTIYGSNNAGIVNGSTDENVPDSWNFTTGNLGGGKFDALASSSFTDPENGKLFLDLGFVRATTSGDTFLAFELNQRQPGYRLDPNEADPANPYAVPTRTAGDLLVTYHVGTAGAHTLGLCAWDGDEHSGQWEEFTPDLSGAAITNQSCPALSISLYQAAINDGLAGRQGAIPGAENFLNLGTDIDAGQFGEAVVNLTEALRDPNNPNGPQPCIDFGYVWLHSRSTDSLTSAQQDFILPESAVSIGNCSVEGRKFEDRDGDGSRSIDEPLLAGWTIFVDYNGNGVLDNDKDGTFVNDNDGIVEPGEEEPYDVTADGTGTEPLGSYRITKVQRSTNAPNGTWEIREVLQPTWDCTAAVGGGAVLAPNVCPEDTSTNPDSALGFRLAWTDNEIYSGRDFGNRRQPAQLKVVKHVVNDGGGTATADAWSLHVAKGGVDVTGSPKPGNELGDTYTLEHGQSYKVTETGGPSGYAATYSGDCDADGDVTVSAGETKTCTITNDDIAPELTVIKHVVNDDGGTKTAADFTITVDDPGTNPASFPGAEAPGTDVTVDPGSYEVTEGAHDGYAVDYSADCKATIAIGETKTCTITNDDIAPTLTVIKTVVNKNGSTAVPSDFTMHIDGTAGNETFPGAAAPGTTKTLQAGDYAVTETGAKTADYNRTESADCAGTLEVGDAKTCTITNTRKTSTITVVKDLIPASDSGRFDLKVDDDVVKADAGDGDGSGPVEVNTGTHTVSEVAGSVGALGDYISSIKCGNDASVPGTGPVEVTVASEENVTCTVTNTRKATVTVLKVTEQPDAATQFAFSSGLPETAGPPAIAADGSFSLADGQSVTTKVAPGTYPVSENDPRPQGYKLVGLSCTEDKTQNTAVATGDAIPTARNATIEADAGETITCTFTNRKVIGQTVVLKAGDTFAYHGDTVTYTFSVSNTGNSPLHDVHVSDDKCPNVSADPTSKSNDDGDALLETIGADGTGPEVWVFTCSYTIGEHQAGESNPVTNTATVSASDEYDRPVADTDTHDTTLLHQSIALVKTGPATALAGSLVTYTITATNTGDTSYAAPLVVVGDALCEAPPARTGVGSDATPGMFDPGDAWTYTCSVQTTVGQTAVHNVATVNGTDVNGRQAGAQAVADTVLSQPVQGSAAPEVLAPASARLRGPTGCMPATARFIVTGKRIARVTFTVDGRRKKVVTKPDRLGRYIYTLKRGSVTAKTHRVRAQITFLGNSTLTTKSLRMTFTKCRAAVRPTFTG